MPDGLAALSELGVEIPPTQSHRLRGIKFVSGELSTEAHFPKDKGLGVRRTLLHSLMIESAHTAGVSLLWQTPVTGLCPQIVKLGNESFRARWIIGADGGNSLARRWAGLDRPSQQTRYAFRRHYHLTPWSDYAEIHWGPNCQVYITPVAPDEICVALVSRDPHLRLESALNHFPKLAARLRNTEPSSAERGAASSTRKLRRVYRDNIALIGDASGSVDCITGEGLCLAFRQAQTLADCLAHNDLSSYQREHVSLARRPNMMARILLALDKKPSLRQRAMKVFERNPRLFSRMVEMHVGTLSPLNFAANSTSLGLQMLFA